MPQTSTLNLVRSKAYLLTKSRYRGSERIVCFTANYTTTLPCSNFLRALYSLSAIDIFARVSGLTPRLLFDAEPPAGAGRTIALSHPDSRTVACASVWQHGPQVGVEFDFSEESLGLISICIRNLVDIEPHPQVADA